MSRTVSYLHRHFGAMLVFLFTVSPISDMAIRFGLVDRVIPAASKLLPYEAPGLKTVATFFSQDAFAAPMVSPV